MVYAMCVKLLGKLRNDRNRGLLILQFYWVLGQDPPPRRRCRRRNQALYPRLTNSERTIAVDLISLSCVTSVTAEGLGKNT